METPHPAYEVNITGLVRKQTATGSTYLLMCQTDGQWCLPNGFMRKYDEFKSPIRRACHIELNLNPTFFYFENEYRPLFGIHQLYFYMKGEYLSGRPKADDIFVSARFMNLGRIIHLIDENQISQPSLTALEKALGFSAQMLKYQG